jgi:hypothetical protein
MNMLDCWLLVMYLISIHFRKVSEVVNPITNKITHVVFQFFLKYTKFCSTHTSSHSIKLEYRKAHTYKCAENRVGTNELVVMHVLRTHTMRFPRIKFSIYKEDLG